MAILQVKNTDGNFIEIPALQGKQGIQGTQGTQGDRGYGFTVSVDRPGFSESNWNTYGEIGHAENWSDTQNLVSQCRVGDIFAIVGTATDTGNAHILYYKRADNRATLYGVCVAHSIAKAGAKGAAGPAGLDGLVGSAVTTGTGSAYTASINGLTLTQSKMIMIFPHTINTAGATLNVNNLGAKPIYYNGSIVKEGQLPSKAAILLIYDTTIVSNGAWHCVYSYDTTYENASSTTAGLLKARLDGTTLYLTNDGNDA